MVGDYALFDLPEPDGRVRRAFILDRKQPLRAESLAVTAVEGILTRSSIP